MNGAAPGALPPYAAADGDPLAARWWEGVSAGELRYQWCPACERAVFYPRARCPGCLGDRLVWEVSAGEGSIAAVTVVRRAPGAAFASLVPYAVALVDLDEGFRLLTNVVDVAAEEVAIGQRVKVSFREGPEGGRLPVFAPA